MRNEKMTRFVYDRRKTATSTIAAKVELEIYFSRSSRKIIPTDVYLFPNQWKKGKVVNHPDAHSITVKLERFRSKFDKILLRMESDGDLLTLESFNNNYSDSSICGNGSFLDYMYDRIATQTMRDSSRRRKLVAYGALRRFGRIGSFDSLTEENINRFDMFLRDTDPSLFNSAGKKVVTRTQVTLHDYHKSIKPYILEAHRLGYIKDNPYYHFKDVRGQSKERNPLSQDEIDRLIALDLPEKLTKVRDLFIFAAHTGLSYADLGKFNYDTDVVYKDDFPFIDGERIKTDSRFFTPILPPAIAVLKRYNNKLPILSIQKYNDYLHLLEDKAGINKSLTSHLARHTFATISLNRGVPIEIVARMLGHKNIKITQIYAKILTSSIEYYANILRD